MKYDQIPQTQVIDSIVPNQDGHQVPGGAVVQFASDHAVGVRYYGVPIGQQPQPLPASADEYVITNDVVGAQAAYIANLLTCAAVIYIYTNAGVPQRVVVYHAHTGMIQTGTPLGSAFDPLNVAPADIHVVFASAESMNQNPIAGIQTASAGLHTLLAAGIPQGNIRVLTGCPNMFGANARGDVGMMYTQGFMGNDLPQRIGDALIIAGGAGPVPQSAFAERELLQMILGSQINHAHDLHRDTTARNALQMFCDRLTAPTFQPGSFAVAFTRALENEIFGVQTATHVNGRTRLDATLAAIDVGVRQL